MAWKIFKHYAVHCFFNAVEVSKVADDWIQIYGFESNHSTNWASSSHLISHHLTRLVLPKS